MDSHFTTCCHLCCCSDWPSPRFRLNRTWSRNCAWALAGAWDYEDYELRRRTWTGSMGSRSLGPGSRSGRSTSRIPGETFPSWRPDCLRPASVCRDVRAKQGFATGEANIEAKIEPKININQRKMAKESVIKKSIGKWVL